MSKIATRAAMAIHVGEDYATMSIDDSPVCTATYPSQHRIEQLGLICERFNVHEELVEAAADYLAVTSSLDLVDQVRTARANLSALVSRARGEKVEA